MQPDVHVAKASASRPPRGGLTLESLLLLARRPYSIVRSFVRSFVRSVVCVISSWGEKVSWGSINRRL